jgi:hypothetical protein
MTIKECKRISVPALDPRSRSAARHIEDLASDDFFGVEPGVRNLVRFMYAAGMRPVMSCEGHAPSWWRLHNVKLGLLTDGRPWVLDTILGRTSKQQRYDMSIELGKLAIRGLGPAVAYRVSKFGSELQSCLLDTDPDADGWALFVWRSLADLEKPAIGTSWEEVIATAGEIYRNAEREIRE